MRISYSSMMFSPWLIICTIFAILNLQVNALLSKESPKPKRIDHGLYHELQVYTTYASAAYQRDCPHPPFNSTVVKYINIKNTSTQAVLFQDDARKEFILAFPGTRGPVDVKTDHKLELVPYRTFGVGRSRCPRCRVHRGELAAWNSIAEEATKYLDLAIMKHRSYKIVLAGHSLGGAITSLATGSLRSAKYPIKASYTFGQPRTGNVHYADFIDRISGVRHGSRGSFHRVTHANDGVPQSPRQRVGGYHHHSTEYWERNDKSGGQDSHNTYRCFGQEPTNCNDSTKSKTIIDNAHGHYSGVNMGNAYVCHR